MLVLQPVNTSSTSASPFSTGGTRDHSPSSTPTTPSDSSKICTSPESPKPVLLSCIDAGKCVNGCAAYGRICPLSALEAGRAAKLKVESMMAVDSLLFGSSSSSSLCSQEQLQPEPSESFRRIDISDVIMGEKLGEGGYCTVHACALRDEPMDESCAIKSLKPQIAAVKKDFAQGAGDLAVEALLLGKLHHPNIVKLRAVPACCVESIVSSTASSSSGSTGPKDGSNKCNNIGFFIVLDRLVETLEQRIHRWQVQMEKCSHGGMFYRMSKEYKDKQKSMLRERLQVALDIANAVAYLHSLNVAYRDLKPDNCGFTRDGTLKLFDFGLAREETNSIRCEDGRYRMTGHTGSRRYMAREVAKDEPYDKSVDVYSFGILLWEICSLEKPFQGFCCKKHQLHVIEGGERPRMDHQHTAHWPVNLQWLMKSCWSANPKDRPSFEVIKATLESVLEDLATVQSDKVRATSTSGIDIGSTSRSLPSLDKSAPPDLAHVKKVQRIGGGLRVQSHGLKRPGS